MAAVGERSGNGSISREALVQELLRLKPFLRDKGVEHLALFGSRARNDARQDSDVDVLIEIDEKVGSFSLFDLVGVESDLTEKLGLPSSVVMRRSLRPEFARSIERDVIEIF